MDNALTPMNLLTKVRVLRGVPFDSNYRNVCDGYTNADNQYAVISGTGSGMTSRVKYSFDAVSPIRHQNVLRLPVCADYIYDCNYICWQNANFNNKWFYAFITKVDWININMCFVHYQIDIWNTWYFDGTTSNRTRRGWSMEQCFVEREHTNDDTVGANLVPENLETGEYVWQSISSTEFSDNMSICAVATVKEDFSDSLGIWGLNAKGNTFFSGLNIINFGYGVGACGVLLAWLTNLATRPAGSDAVKSIIWVPRQFFSQTGDVVAGDITYSNNNFAPPQIQFSSNITGYGTPRNNKLLTYPYHFIHITNNQGQCGDFRFEYFSNLQSIKFEIDGSIANGVPEMMIYPLGYKNISGYPDERLWLNNFPQVPWVSNTFLDWMSTNWANLGTGVLSGVVSGMGSIAGGYTPPSASISPMHINEKLTPSNIGTEGAYSGGRVTETPANVSASGMVGGASGILQVANVVANTYIKSSMPPTAHGTASPTLLREFGQNDFTYGRMSIKPEFARIIDDYFDRFGYATHETKQPNLRGRSQWNYVKTIESSIQPLYMSLEDVASLEDIFDRGVTIWHNINNIGNYSLSNPIV